MQPPTIAIVSTEFGKYSETFIQRHVEKLFSGRTAVVAFEAMENGPFDRPFHVYPRVGAIRRAFGKRSVRRQDSDLVEFLQGAGVTHALCEFGYVATKIALPIARSGVPVFCYFRGADASRRLRDRRYVARLGAIFPHLSGVIAVSQSLLNNLAEAGLTHPNSKVIPSGTDINAVTPGCVEESHILTVGRLVPKKDPLSALEAFARVAGKHNDLRWTIVGSGTLEAALRSRADTLGVAHRITLAGPRPHHEVVELMRRTTAYFQAFRTAPDGDTEGMPGAIQEAMAAGRAIVTTRHAGIPEHITHGKTGLLFDEGDINGLAEGLNHVLSSPQFRKELGAAARRHACEALDYRKLFASAEEFIIGRALSGS